MGLLDRMVSVLSAKANAILDHYENPAESLDYAYELEVEELQELRAAHTDIVTTRQLLDLECGELGETTQALETQATEAVQLGRDDLAREAIARCFVIRDGISSMATENGDLADEEERLRAAIDLLERKIANLRVEKEVMEARSRAIGDTTELSNATSALREEVSMIKAAIQRARDRIEALRAQARAVDTLLTSGVLTTLTETPPLLLTELKNARSSERVDEALARFKRARRPSSR